VLFYNRIALHHYKLCSEVYFTLTDFLADLYYKEKNTYDCFSKIKFKFTNILSLIDMKYFLLILGLFVFENNHAQGYPETLPEFEVYTLEDEVFSKKDILKDTYAHFVYFSPTCGHCMDAFKVINLKASQIEDADVQLYLISANTSELTRDFFKLYAPKIQNLSNIHILKDVDYKFAELFDVAAFPTSFLYKENNLVKVFEGASEALLFLDEVK
jgi:thiol-disulfide isomerase/thioredoxin